METKITVDKFVFSHFLTITDPRSDINKRHKLIDIIAISICAVLCGCEGWEEIEDFGKSRQDWFKKFLELPNGIPSHDRIRVVFVHLDPIEFENCFRSWISDFISDLGGEIINIDGKTSRRTFDTARGKKPIHMVSGLVATSSLLNHATCLGK